MTAARARLLLLVVVVVAVLIVVACEPPPEARRYETVLVLGDAMRDAVGVGEPPPSSIAVEVWVPDPALCHAETAGAVAASDAIRWAFKEHDWVFACNVAYCESRFRAGAVGREHERGLFQIHPIWFAQAAKFGLDLFDLEDNAAMARHIRDVSGWRAWTCAR